MNRKPDNNRAEKFACARGWAGGFCSVAVLLYAIAGPAIAGSFDGALGKTKYVTKTGDVNNDGQNDVLMIAVPTLVMIPLDDDINIPIQLPVPSPTFALLSTGYGTYTLVTNPGAELIGNPGWAAANQNVTYAGPSGQFAGSVTITAATADQASFVISMAADTGLLQITSTTAPASAWATRVAGKESYTYDALGRLRSVTYPNGVQVTYDYDAAGNRTLSKTAKQ